MCESDAFSSYNVKDGRRFQSKLLSFLVVFFFSIRYVLHFIWGIFKATGTFYETSYDSYDLLGYIIIRIVRIPSKVD